jgi:hypothetical protein
MEVTRVTFQKPGGETAMNIQIRSFDVNAAETGWELPAVYDHEFNNISAARAVAVGQILNGFIIKRFGRLRVDFTPVDENSYDNTMFSIAFTTERV